MKKCLAIFLSFILVSPVLAATTMKKLNTTPEGVFKKNRNGDFVQYDKKGKKVGVYKLINGRLVKVK